MANGAFLQGLAGFGTGLLQGFGNQMSTRLEREADKRQAEFLANLDKRMRDSAKKDAAGRLTAAYDTVYEYEKENGPLEAPTPESVSSRELFDHTRRRVYAKNRPLLESGEVTAAQFRKLNDDSLAEEMGKLQDRRNQYMMRASEFLQTNPAQAAQNFAEASKYSQDGISTVFDPATGQLVDVDERTGQAISAPYQLTQDRIARDMMGYKNYIAREDEQAQQQAVQGRFDVQQAGIESRFVRQQEGIQSRFDTQEERLRAAARGKGTVPGSFRWMQQQDKAYRQAASEVAEATGLEKINDQLDQLSELASVQGGVLPEDQSLEQARLQDQARVASMLTRMGQSIIGFNWENLGARPVTSLLMRDLADARAARVAGQEPSRGKGRLLVGEDIQITTDRQAVTGNRKLIVNGQPLWMPDEFINVIVDQLPRTKKVPEPESEPEPEPASTSVVPISVAPAVPSPPVLNRPIGAPTPAPAPAPSYSGIQQGIVEPLSIY